MVHLPQLKALGHSSTAKFYGLADVAEASAYRAHPLLGTRLGECCTLMRAHSTMGAKAVLGSVDAMKWRSCLTLYAQVPNASPLVAELIATFYGTPDENILALLA